MKILHTTLPRRPYIYLDLVFCLVVVPLIALVFPVERWFHNFEWYIILVAIWFYGLYVFNRLVTMPWIFSGRRKMFMSFGIIVASMLINYLLSSIELYPPRPNFLDIGIHRLLPRTEQYQQAVWSLYTIVETFSMTVGLIAQIDRQRALQSEIEARRDKAEINLYRAQVNPHFMFNTLNSVYGLFITRNPAAISALERYITLMRYIHTSSLREEAPLSEEAEYIRQYVALQQLRLNEMTSVDLHISLENPQLEFPPMLLVTFVENCFKHGVSPIEPSCIHISMVEQQGQLTFTTSNHIFPRKGGSQMGLDNCRRRLNLLFPSHLHSLNISSASNQFNVNLTITLHNK